MNEEQQTVSCGIWTTLEILINKETNGKIWDKNENWLKPVATKKKDRLVANKLRWNCTVELFVWCHQIYHELNP